MILNHDRGSLRSSHLVLFLRLYAQSSELARPLLASSPKLDALAALCCASAFYCIFSSLFLMVTVFETSLFLLP